MQDICDRIAILYKGELKEMGRVDSLLKVRNVTQILTSLLSDAAQAEVREVVEPSPGRVISMDNPTTTLEELFLNIIRQSEAHPGPAPARAEFDGQRAVPVSYPWSKVFHAD